MKKQKQTHIYNKKKAMVVLKIWVKAHVWGHQCLRLDLKFIIQKVHSLFKKQLPIIYCS